MKLNEIIRKSIESEEKNANLNPYEYDKLLNKIECEIDKRESKISERIKLRVNSFMKNFKLPFNYKDIIEVGLLIAIVVGIPLSIVHYTKYYKKYEYVDSIKTKDTIEEVNNSVNLAIERIKANYKQVVSTNEFEDNYVLVQYKREYDGTSFDLYNLKTGHKDEIVTSGFSKLIQIVNENEILFFEGGKEAETPSWSTPYYVRYIRIKQIANTEGSFKGVIEPAFFNVEESIKFGEKNSDMISKVDILGELFSVTFSPAPGKESMFLAAYSAVPVTTTNYIKDKNQLVLEFKDCEIDEKLINAKYNISDNEYISGYEIIKNQNDSKLIVNLKSMAKAYNCSTAGVDDVLVKLDIKFMNKEEESSSLNQTKSLEALLKSYNYNVIVNSGFDFEIEIPQNFVDSSELKEQYLQYCNELSKAMGYDISILSGKTVDVKGCGVNKNGDTSKTFDVISIGLNGEICGVWMLENKTSRLLSLTGESFMEVTKKSWQQWSKENGIKVNEKDIDNEFKNITLKELYNMGLKK
ncbi:hypothetical protein [Clostridium sp.]|uniref:hypothetical protein n=1 Tax=Clostridium sp. TaxID=1506 RepID=UPI003D6CF96C